MCKHPAGPPRIGAADRAGPSRSRGRAGETTAVSRGRRARSRPLRRRLMPDKSATALTAEYPRVAGRRIISRPDGRTGLTAVRGLGRRQLLQLAGGRPARPGCVLSVSAQDKWRRRQQTQQETRRRTRGGSRERWQRRRRTD